LLHLNEAREPVEIARNSSISIQEPHLLRFVAGMFVVVVVTMLGAVLGPAVAVIVTRNRRDWQ